MKTDREIEKIVAGLDMKKGPKEVVVQYGRGMLDGMHIAYVSVARKMLSQGQSVSEVRQFLSDLTDREALNAILKEAQGK